jgi:hypothetical protein
MSTDTETRESALLTDKELAVRWRCHYKTAIRRMKRLGVKPIKLNRFSVHYRWSDVLRIEEQCQ